MKCTTLMQACRNLDCAHCADEKEMEVCQSAAGFYIGTKTPEGFPNCRITVYMSQEEATEMLEMSQQV